MVAQIVLPADGKSADLTVEDCRLVRHIQVPLEILLMEVAFLAEMTEVVAVSLMQFHVIFELGVVYKRLLAPLELALEPRLFVIHAMPRQVFWRREKFAANI